MFLFYYGAKSLHVLSVHNITEGLFPDIPQRNSQARGNGSIREYPAFGPGSRTGRKDLRAKVPLVKQIEFLYWLIGIQINNFRAKKSSMVILFIVCSYPP